MSILDLSKILMYEFQYNYIKKKFGSKANLLFTDTDSLCYKIETEDFFKDISADVQEKFDTSNFSLNHPSGIPTGINKKVSGMFKDDAGGEIISEFVGLRAKLHAIKKLDGEEEKMCKGVKGGVFKKSISFEDFKKCLFSGRQQLRNMNIIRCHKHEIYTETVNKIALSANDDKRIIMPDNILTLAYGFQGWGHGAQGKAEGPWERQGRLYRGQGALTETGEHTGSKQRPHKIRDFEKCASMPETYLLIFIKVKELQQCCCLLKQNRHCQHTLSWITWLQMPTTINL